MNKQEFLDALRAGLSGLPQEDAEERLAFYGEMIDDRVEDGLSEAETVAELGPAEELAARIVAETPLPVLVREKMKDRRRLRAWELALLILGFPLWFPLLLAAGVVLFSLYIVLWTLVVSLIAVAVSFAAAVLGSIVMGAVVSVQGNVAQGLALLSAGLILAGLSIFLFFGCKDTLFPELLVYYFCWLIIVGPSGRGFHLSTFLGVFATS